MCSHHSECLLLCPIHTVEEEGTRPSVLIHAEFAKKIEKIDLVKKKMFWYFTLQKLIILTKQEGAGQT